MSRYLLAVVAVVLMAALSGCATISVDVVVSDEETIEKYEVEAEMSEFGYSILAEQARESGYSGIDEYLHDSVGDKEAIGDFSYEEERNSGVVRATAVYEDVNASVINDEITIEKRDGEIRYEDRFFLEESVEQDDFKMNYSLTMPGEISESNANEVDGDTAKYTYPPSGRGDGLYVFARSEPASVVSAPGFTGISAAISLLVTALVGLRRLE